MSDTVNIIDAINEKLQSEDEGAQRKEAYEALWALAAQAEVAVTQSARTALWNALETI